MTDWKVITDEGKLSQSVTTRLVACGYLPDVKDTGTVKSGM